MDRAYTTRANLVADLNALPGEPLFGSCVMVHTRMSDLGWVVGGAPTVVASLREAVGPDGTLLVLTGWEDRPPYHQSDWDPAIRRLYRDEAPGFDPAVCMAERAFGRIPETVRTWPGASRSRHPVCGFAALGARAERLVAGQSLDEGYGEGSPLQHLVDADGVVLLIGDLFENVTLFHYAEYLAAVSKKRYVEYEMPVMLGDNREWRRIRELDSSRGALFYEDLELEVDPFEVITRSALAAGIGGSGSIADASAHVFPARALVDHARSWMQEQFGSAG